MLCIQLIEFTLLFIPWCRLPFSAQAQFLTAHTVGVSFTFRNFFKLNFELRIKSNDFKLAKMCVIDGMTFIIRSEGIKV